MNWPLVLVVSLAPFVFCIAVFAALSAYVSLWHPHTRMERVVGAGFAFVGAVLTVAWIVAVLMVGAVS